MEEEAKFDADEGRGSTFKILLTNVVDGGEGDPPPPPPIITAIGVVAVNVEVEWWDWVWAFDEDDDDDDVEEEEEDEEVDEEDEARWLLLLFDCDDEIILAVAVGPVPGPVEPPKIPHSLPCEFTILQFYNFTIQNDTSNNLKRHNSFSINGHIKVLNNILFSTSSSHSSDFLSIIICIIILMMWNAMSKLIHLNLIINMLIGALFF